ncbi:MAG: MaoC/PaaZ C-terminal domain-containing protein [Syntrophales bacterium]
MAKELYFQDINVKDQMPLLVKDPVKHMQLVKYAGASGDFNPLHVDPEFGKTVGIGSQIAHGMLVMGFVGQAITNWIPKKYIRKFSVRFVGMTIIDDVVTVTGKVKSKKQEGGNNLILCNVYARNKADELLITGSFEASLPDKK